MPSVKPQRISSQVSSAFPAIGFRRAASVPREPAKLEAGGGVVGRRCVGLLITDGSDQQIVEELRAGARVALICVVVDEDAIDALEVFHRHRGL